MTEFFSKNPKLSTDLSRAAFIFNILSLRVEALMEPLDASFSSNSHAENTSFDFFTSKYVLAIRSRDRSKSSKILLNVALNFSTLGVK